ncbi:MAG TPA: preprotein translocase subunit SecE [Thermoanaerobaculia bacterium]|nr:preprotein translocase subunit SecE [Thermoanaerobaculia bacterium]
MAFEPKDWWRRTTEFWRETKSEMKKVSWPGRAEVVGTTTVVIVAVILFGVYLWLCDLIFYRAINLLFTRFGAGT